MSSNDYYILYGVIFILALGFVYGVCLLIQNIRYYHDLPSRYWEKKLETRSRILKTSGYLLGTLILFVIYVLFMFH